TNIDPNSHGPYIDARDRAVDYAFYGIDQTAQPAYQLDPNWHSGPMWQTIYKSIIDELKVRFVSQLGVSQFLNGADPSAIFASWVGPLSMIQFDPIDDTVNVNFNYLIQAIVSGAPSDPAAAATYYQQTMSIVRSLRVDLFGENSQPV